MARLDVIRTQNLTKIYGHRKIALNAVELRVPKGSIFGFLGPNGAGKTTAFRLMLGLQRPTAGRVEILGKRVGPNSSDVRRHVGYLPTNPEFPPDMTPITYLDFVGVLCGLSREARSPRLGSLVRAVGLLGAQSQRIGTFSTGMKTRLGIAASLMNDPSILLWDEPCSGLDPAGRRHTMDLITWLGRTKTIVVSSHILGDIDQVCTHVGVLSDGQLIFSGTMGEMKQRIHVDTLVVELSGGDGVLERFRAASRAIEGLDGLEREGSRFHLRPVPGASLGELVAAVAGSVREAGGDILSLSTGQGRMEDAYLQMLEQDGARGFLRACGDAEGGEANGCVCGTPAS